MKIKSIRIIVAVALCWIAYSVPTTGLASEDANSSSESAAESSAESSGEKNADQLAAVLAIVADAEYGAYLGGECLTCHAPDESDGSIPLIHGKNKADIASALLEYKHQQRTNDVMRGVAAALTDEEIAALAAYFSEQ